MVANGSIQNTMIPMIRLGEMFLIAAESQSDDLGKGSTVCQRPAQKTWCGKPSDPYS